MTLHLCSRCRGHGLSVPRKGHKKACPYLNCPCYTCSTITAKNQAAAEHYHTQFRVTLDTNNGLENVSVSSIEETQGLDLSVNNLTRCNNSTNTCQCPNRFNVLLVDVAVGPDTGHFRFNDQSTQTSNNIGVTNVELSEVTSTHSTSFIIDGPSNQQDLKSRSTDEDFVLDTGCFSLSVDHSTQTRENLIDKESVDSSTSNRSTSLITVVLGNQDDVMHKNTGGGAIPDTDHFDLDDLLTQASNNICITIEAEPIEPSIRSHPTFPTPDSLRNQCNLTSRNTQEYFSPGFDNSNPKGQSTQTRNNIISEIESVEPTTSSRSTSPIADRLANQCNQTPEHIDQEVLKRFGCIPFSVILHRLRIPEIRY